MSAQIVFDDGGGPVLGSVDNGSLGSPVNVSNFDNTGVLGWFWEFVYKPPGSSAALSAPTLASTAFTPDVRGTYLLRLTTYLDALRTAQDDADEQGYAVRLEAPFDWRVPAAGETRQFDPVAGWAPAREVSIRDVHAFMNGGYPAIQGAVNEETTVLGAEVVMGGFVFDGGALGPLGSKLRFVGRLDTATPGTSVSLRLYDMGAPGTPGPGVLRATATIPFADAGSIRLVETALSAVAVPGTNIGEVHNASRLYELRLIITGGTPGDAAKLHYAGLALT